MKLETMIKYRDILYILLILMIAFFFFILADKTRTYRTECNAHWEYKIEKMICVIPYDNQPYQKNFSMRSSPAVPNIIAIQ